MAKINQRNVIACEVWYNDIMNKDRKQNIYFIKGTNVVHRENGPAVLLNIKNGIPCPIWLANGMYADSQDTWVINGRRII